MMQFIIWCSGILYFEVLCLSPLNEGGDHTRTMTKVTSKVGGLVNFLKRKATCVGCKVVLKRENEAVCDHCRSKEGVLYMKEMEKQACLEEKFSRLWVECQRCQDSLHEDVLCSKCVEDVK